jgi:Tfp pilus assembly protein PilF
MEVAMRAAVASVLLGILFLSTGCTEVITYAGKSRDAGLRLYSEGATADAAGAFRNAIRQNPRDFESHYYLGICYDDLKQRHQAFSEYRISLDVMNQMGRYFYDPDFRQKVITAYSISLARAENDSEINALEKRAQASSRGEEWFILAKAFRSRGDADRAIDCYARAARADSSDFYIRKEFGLYLLDPLAQNQDAEYWLRQAYRLQAYDDDVNAGLQKLGISPKSARLREPAPRLTPPRQTVIAPTITPVVQPIAEPITPLKGSAVNLPRD